jgi:hypothetical protein
MHLAPVLCQILFDGFMLKVVGAHNLQHKLDRTLVRYNGQFKI